MRKALGKDRKKAVMILQRSFTDNPTLKFMTRSKHKENQMAKVARFAFDVAIRRGGVFLSDNEKGIAICYEHILDKGDIVDLFLRIKLCLTAIPIKKWIRVFRHNNFVEHCKPKRENYLYFWFFGVEPDEKPRTSARDLLTNIFQMAIDQKKDIYAETTVLQNKIVYERFGFVVYKEWYNPNCDLMVWFLKKPYSLRPQYLSGLDYR